EGGEITVKTGTAVTDKAKIGRATCRARAYTVTYKAYTSKKCEGTATEAGKVTVTAGKVPDSTPQTLAAGTYFWQAEYSGDANNLGSKSTCGSEVLTVTTGPTPTALTTMFSGEGKEGGEITVKTGTAVTDKA